MIPIMIQFSGEYEHLELRLSDRWGFGLAHSTKGKYHDMLESLSIRNYSYSRIISDQRVSVRLDYEFKRQDYRPVDIEPYIGSIYLIIRNHEFGSCSGECLLVEDSTKTLITTKYIGDDNLLAACLDNDIPVSRCDTGYEARVIKDSQESVILNLMGENVDHYDIFATKEYFNSLLPDNIVRGIEAGIIEQPTYFNW